jgi:hypothetical protein
MKDFKEFAKDINEGVLNSRVSVRDKLPNYPYTYKLPQNAEPLGWFNNKYNIFGWVITKLEKADNIWFRDEGVSIDGVYRVYSDNGNTNIIKLNINSGTYAFINNDHYEKTDEIKFEKMTKFKQLFIDVGKEKEFGV